jgi:hypothetical protein
LTTTIYADFTDSTKYIPSLKKLVESIGFVFNAKIFDTSITSLSDSISKAIHSNLPLAKKPFYRPFNYIGDTIEKASKEVEQKANEVGNIIVDTEEFRMLLEAEGNYISYVEVDIKQTAPWSLNQEFDSEPILGVFSINPSEYELARKQTHYPTYYDHKRKIKIDVSCSYEGGPLSIGFSSKWYGM